MNSLGEKLKGKRLLVTGGTGSFGYQITERLLKIPETLITVFSRDEDKHREMKSFFDSNRLKFCIGDVRDYDRLQECMKGTDIVLHAGALKQIPAVEFSPMEAIKTNTIAAYNIMKAADKQGVEKVIGISTDKAVKPVNAYGMSKALMEKILLGDDIDSNTRYSCVRYGNVLGSRGSVLPVWDKIMAQEKPIPITSFKMRRFFLSLTQATDLILFTIENMKGKEIFVRDAPALMIKNLAQVYAELKTGDKNYPLNEIGIRAGEKLDELLYSEEETVTTLKYGNTNFFRISRPVSQDNTLFNHGDYGTANAKQLGKAEIKAMLKHTKWQK